MREAVDIATGEVVDDVRSYLNRLYAESPQSARDTLQEEHRDLVRALLFVARADGQFREAERVVVRRHLRELAGDPRVTDGMIDGLFREIETPTLQASKLAVGRIVAAQVVDPARLEQICREIVATQKTVSPGEEEALSYIAARIARETRLAAAPPSMAEPLHGRDAV